MTTYLDFLKLVLKLGPKIPQAMAIIEHIISDVQELYALVMDVPATGDDPMYVTESEGALEVEVAGRFASAEPVYGIGSIELLRSIYAFLQKNPKVAELIFTILKAL